MRRALTKLTANADRLADAFENHEPASEDVDATLRAFMAVKLAAFRRSQAKKALAHAVHNGLDAHPSWRQLGEAIGTSGEAARQRYTDP